ncbi:VOC family protein [Rhodococcoides yunnanense]|uniref:VOC family protein n=1 Tax=Rhodococcoides yunnanense TaxID=278209 RepID=A0ABU4BKG6_9NOCA|nr:VOC family protein [Rhodococcus yunnanensis]MDV6264718.1 VOC family protein [Rhodococcus yunnanensis]
MGLSEHTASETVFMYDARGPRAAPALELVQWHDPQLITRRDLDADAPSYRVIGYRIDSLASLTGSGHVKSVVVRGRSRKSIRVIDPDGVTVEVVEIAAAETDPESAMLSHERLVVSDLERSLAWYSKIGFVVRPDDDKVARSVPGVSLYLPEDPTFSFELESPPKQVAIEPKVANTQGLYRIAIAVEDVTAAHAALVEDDPATPEPGFVSMPDVPTGGFTVLFLFDPDGLVVELVDRPRKAVHRPLNPV